MTLELNNVYHMDCIDGMRRMIEQGIKADLVVTDPPYLIKNTNAGGNSPLSRSIQQMNDEIEQNELTKGITTEYLDLIWELMRVPNIYIWCNKAQIVQYLDFFVKRHKCSYDLLVWWKPNSMPLFNNKYLTDKEYILYFRRGGLCQPQGYEQAKTVFQYPINIKDKRKYGHPTIKPLHIIETLIENSSKPGDVVFDPFMGSFTTAVAAKKLFRNYIGFEICEKYYASGEARMAELLTEGAYDFR